MFTKLLSFWKVFIKQTGRLSLGKKYIRSLLPVSFPLEAEGREGKQVCSQISCFRSRVG